MSNLLLVKPEKLDKVQKPIDEAKYFQWKETLLDCANQKPDWSDYTTPTSTWKARNEDPTRGVADAAKRNHLNSYINYIATFAPGSLVHDIVNESTGNAYIDSRIRSMYQLKSTGASAFKYFKKTKSFNHAGSQTYQDFYYELRAVKYETLHKAGQDVTCQGKKITANEVMTPSIQNSIVVDWLAGIDEDLVEEVEQYYARDLENVSLVDMQETIAQGLPALLSKIKTKKDIGAYKVKLEQQVTAGAVRYNQGGRGGGRNNGNGNQWQKNSYGNQRQQRPAPGFGSQRREPCSLCKSYGFALRAETHVLKDCLALKSMQKREKGMLARQINATLDGSELEESSSSGTAQSVQEDQNDIPWLDGDSSD